MKILEVTKKDLVLKDYKQRSALESDASMLINEDTLLVCDGKPVILYCKIKKDTSALRWAVRSIKYDTYKRTAGLKTTSKIFGYMPKLPMRKDFCSATAMAKEYPKEHFVVTDFAKTLAEFYKESFPEVYTYHFELAEEKLKKEWTIGNTPFTSGIINKNNPLKYHHDSGNFRDVLSNMIVFKRDCKGGRLVCPEYNVKFECTDDSVVIFDGQKILHGVSPLTVGENGYRYSVVYYSLQQMWKCEDVNLELDRIKQVKTDRETKRLHSQFMDKLHT